MGIRFLNDYYNFMAKILFFSCIWQEKEKKKKMVNGLSAYIALRQCCFFVVDVDLSQGWSVQGSTIYS